MVEMNNEYDANLCSDNSGAGKRRAPTHNNPKDDSLSRNANPNSNSLPRVSRRWVSLLLGVLVLLCLGIGIYFFMKSEGVTISNNSNDNAQATEAASKSTISMNELVSHNDPTTDCWLLIHDTIYDLTEYSLTHPGGPEFIWDFCGTNATKDFDLEHRIEILALLSADTIMGTLKQEINDTATNNVTNTSTSSDSDDPTAPTSSPIVVRIPTTSPNASFGPTTTPSSSHKPTPAPSISLTPSSAPTGVTSVTPTTAPIAINTTKPTNAPINVNATVPTNVSNNTGGTVPTIAQSPIAQSPSTTKPATVPATIKPTAKPTTKNPTLKPVTRKPTAIPTTPKPTQPPSTKSPTSTPVQSCISLSEVANHATETDCWYILYGMVYDFTNYITIHPGGQRNIFQHCGTDATTVYSNEKKHDQALLETVNANTLYLQGASC